MNIFFSHSSDDAHIVREMVDIFSADSALIPFYSSVSGNFRNVFQLLWKSRGILWITRRIFSCYLRFMLIQTAKLFFIFSLDRDFYRV